MRGQRMTAIRPGSAPETLLLAISDSAVPAVSMLARLARGTRGIDAPPAQGSRVRLASVYARPLVARNGGFQWLPPSPRLRARPRSPRSGWQKTPGTAAIRIGFHWLTLRIADGETGRNSSMGVLRSWPFSHVNGTRNLITA